MNALVVKELSGVSRRWQVYLGRVVYMGLLALFLVPTLLRHDMRALTNPSEYAAIGRTLFYSLFALQMVFVPLMAVSAASDMISKEIRAGTLGLLALTPLTPRRIVMGKWKAALAYSSSLFLCGIPVLATCAYLGGVGVLEIAWSTCLTMASAALAGAVTILYSSVLRAGYTAIISGILTLAGYAIIPIFIIMGARDEAVFKFFCWVHPVYAAFGAAAEMGRFGSSEGWIGATIVSFLLSWLLLRRTAGIVARKILVVDREGRRNDAAGADAVPASGGSPVWDSGAILWKEMRTRRSAGLRKATWIGLILLGAIVLLSMMASRSSEQVWQWFFLWFSAGFFLLMTMASGVSLFVREKEGKQWDVLLSTPLTARQIIAAKLSAGVFNLIALGATFFIFFTLICLADQVPLLGWMMGATSLAAVSAFAYVLAAAMSLRSTSMRAAFSATFGLLGLVLFFLPIILAFYGAFGNRWNKNDFPFVFVTVTNPAAFLGPLSETMVESHSRWRHPHEYDKVFMELIPHFLVHLSFYAAGIVGLLFYMKARFAAITGRRDGE